MPRPKDIGNAGERHHRRILARVWPDIKRYEDRYHPTRDHDNTGGFHVESKKRDTWNVLDVVRNMFVRVPHTRWIIAYEDRNRTLVDRPSMPVGIIPLTELAEILHYAYLGGYNDGHD